jgi:hypothetical protein
MEYIELNKTGILFNEQKYDAVVRGMEIQILRNEAV